MPSRVRGVALVAALSIGAIAASGAAAAPEDPVNALDPNAAPLALGAPTLGALPTGRNAFDRGAHAPAPTPRPDQYVVQLTAPPAALYRGGIKGLAPTAPTVTGQPLAQRADAVRAYTRELDQRQAAVTAAVGGVRPQVEYRTALAGFAAHLDDAQVKALRAQPGVKAVVPERFVRLNTATSDTQPAVTPNPRLAGSEADLLGLPGGLWKRLGGAQHAGEGVIVGVVDSGITPESPSFADRGLKPPAVWNGACEGGEEFPTTTCDNKIIGARWFVDGFGRDHIGAGEYLSPRDEVGHGTNVAGIAVGDNGVDPDVQGNDVGVDRITGIAPAAHLAVYKACWQYGQCSTVDVTAAVDAAVRDGVDVLNLSLGGPADPSTPADPMETALLNADAAGVAVVVSAGNSGTYPGAVGSPARAPWVTAVGATTGTRTFRSTLHVSGAGRTADVPIATVGPGWPAGTQLFDARSASPGSGDPFSDPRFCADGLTAGDVRGRVVLCEAFAPIGIVDPYLKSLGAAGYILVGDDDAFDPELNTPSPSAFVERHDANAIRQVTDGSGGVADVQAPAGSATPWTPDRIAPFSSRGPSDLTGDLLRPDVSAPGVNTLAAYAPNTYASNYQDEGHTKYMPLSGTSMSSPQVAGVDALLTQLHPTWSSAALRSALVTTAKPALDEDGHARAGAVAAGAGRIDPQAAADPGLVFAPSEQEYRDYADGTLKAAQLNLPSVSVGDGTQPATVTRTVTSVASARSSWTASADVGPPYTLDARVSPRTFTVAPGQRQALTIDVSAYEGAEDFQSFALVLTNRQTGQTVRMPVAIDNPGIIDPPATVDVDASAPDGAQPLTATIAGPVEGVGLGLAAPEVRADQQTAAPEFPDLQEYALPVTLDHATPLLAADATTKDGTPLATNIYKDVDGDGRYTPVDQNALVSRQQEGDDPTRWHEADALDLPAGKYLVEVHVPEPHDQPVPFDLRTWRVDDPQPDDPAPAPGLVLDGDGQERPAAPHAFTLRYGGVTGDEPLRGVVDWQGSTAANRLGETVVRLQPADD
jgi:subtilisin family serine protease